MAGSDDSGSGGKPAQGLGRWFSAMSVQNIFSLHFTDLF